MSNRDIPMLSSYLTTLRVQENSFVPPNTIILADVDGVPLPGLLSFLHDEELVVLKGKTFRVVYLNEKSVTLELADPIVKGKDE